MIYFDSTATTKPRKEYLDLYVRLNNEYWFNTTGLYKDALKADMLFNKSALVIKNSLNVLNHDVYFTSGATESNNMAIYGICNKYLDNPKHIITTYLEHASVLNPFKDLEKRGFRVTYLKPNKDGIINIDELKNSLTPDTILVSIMWVNNIIGSVQPIKEVIEVLKNHRAKLHVDAVQGLGKIKPDFNLSDVDMFTLSGHKLHGLKGTGCLVCKDSISLQYMLGGHQQKTFRPGTVDVALSCCLAKCIKDAVINQPIEYSKTLALYKRLLEGIKDVKNIILNRSINSFSPFILSISFLKIKGETVLHMLEEAGIYVGVGSSCNSHSKVSEDTLLYMMDDPSLAKNTIRVSLSSLNKEEEIDLLIEKIKEIGK